MENGLEPRGNAEKMQKKHLEKSKSSRVVDGVPVPSSHTMKLRSDTIISTSLLFRLIIPQRSRSLTTDEVEKKQKVLKILKKQLRD